MKKATLRLGTICAIFCASTSMSRAAEPLTTISFELGEPEAYVLNKGSNVITQVITDSEQVIAGKSSILCDKTQSHDEWCEFFQSKPAHLQFKANGVYTVSFKYRIIEKTGDKGYLYFMMRPATGKGGAAADRGWSEIKDTSGSSGTKLVTFTLGDFKDYRLVIGYRYQGKVIIDDIKIFEGNVVEQSGDQK